MKQFFSVKTVLIVLIFISTSGSAKACNFFSFSPFCQARNAIGAAGFGGAYGFGSINSGLGDLGGFLQQLLGNYQLSGRPYGFYTQNLNSDAYLKALNFNSSGVFQKFN